MWEVEQIYKANDALWRSELEQLESRLNRQLEVLTQKVFACKPDALDAVMAFQDSLELHQLTHLLANPVRAKRAPGRPTKEAEPTPVQGYQLQATLERKANTEETFTRQHSRFILATNQRDKTL